MMIILQNFKNRVLKQILKIFKNKYKTEIDIY